jgi:dynein heavy chain
MEINRCLYDLQQNKTIFSKIGDNKTWEKTDFNYEQDQTRKQASGQYESIIANKMTVVVRKVQNEIYDKCNLKDVDDQDEMKFGQQVKQKPMNLKRREEEEKTYLLQIANRDRERLPNFVRLVDYVMIETLINISHQSMEILLEEMKKERKTGLFNIGIKEEHMTFDPNEEELKENIESTLKNMIEVVKGVHRIPSEVRLGNEEKQEKLPDIGMIISQSVEFNRVRGDMLEKIKRDFKIGGEYIDENYQQVKQMFSFLNSFQMPNWEEGNVTFEEIRQKIQKFTEWNSFIKARIKDIAKGCLNINGIKIANKLTSEL